MRKFSKSKYIAIFIACTALTGVRFLGTPSPALACGSSPSGLEPAQSFAQEVLKVTDPREKCRNAFLSVLKSKDPEGYGIWSSLSAASKAQLDHMIVCGIGERVSSFDVATLVHESTHLAVAQKFVGSKKWNFVLTTGERVSFSQDPKASQPEFSRGQALKVMSPSERKISSVALYLERSGDQSLGDLLDELSAYTHGLRTVLRFAPSLNFDFRDAPLEMMVFTLRYLESMRMQNPDYSKALSENQELQSTMRALFRDAFRVVNESCDRTDLNRDDRRSFLALDTPSSKQALSSLFGKDVPVFASRCVATAKAAL